MDELSVLYVAQSIGRNAAGLGSAVVGLVRELLDLGCRVTIWTPDRYPESQLAHENDLPLQAIGRFPSVGPKAVGFSPTMESASKTTQGRSFDLLHQHGIWMANSRVTMGWRKATARPTVLSPHGSLEEYALRISRFKKRLAAMAYEAKNMREATCLMASSADEARSFRRYGLMQPIAVIPNGISSNWLSSKADSERFRNEFGIFPAKRIFLYLSRIHPKKGLPLLFEAMAGLRSELGDWLLVIAGPDQVGHQHELERMARSLEICQWIKFIGPLSGDLKRDAFGAAEMFVLPTHSENFGIVIAEALGAGLPVLTTRGAPWEDLVKERCGWWTDIETGALRDALGRAIRMPASELVAMGERGRQLVSAKYTWQIAAQKAVILYRWLLGNGPVPEFVLTE